VPEGSGPTEYGVIGSHALFHLIRRPKHIWYASAGVGYSRYFGQNVYYDLKESGYGYYFQFAGGVKRYFGRYFVFFIQTNSTIHQYKTLIRKYGTNRIIKASDVLVSSLDLQAGLVVAFGKKVNGFWPFLLKIRNF